MNTIYNLYTDSYVYRCKYMVKGICRYLQLLFVYYNHYYCYYQTVNGFSTSALEVRGRRVHCFDVLSILSSFFGIIHTASPNGKSLSSVVCLKHHSDLMHVAFM